MSEQAVLAESGILLVDKPVGWTSHDVVQFVRKRFRFRKVGHCGTLDPTATGLLVLVLGRATKLSARLTNQDKVYRGVMELGVETSTDDSEGEVIARRDASGVTRESLEEAFDRFTGEIEQIPPMTSAVKKGGRPLYKLARKGVEIDREPKRVVIHELQLLDFRPPEVEFELHCSKGTYVRTLCADIGRDLGCGAYLKTLRRLASGRFRVEDAVPVEDMKNWERDQVLAAMIPLERVFTYL